MWPHGHGDDTGLVAAIDDLNPAVGLGCLPSVQRLRQVPCLHNRRVHESVRDDAQQAAALTAARAAAASLEATARAMVARTDTG